jgi:hypothetical protein
LTLSEELIQMLGQIAKNRSEIRLLNIYKGLPITYETSINAIGDFEIRVPGSKQQLACLYHQRETYLQGERIPFLIRSQVISLNLAKEDAVLSNFEVAKPDIGKRTQIRVEPDEPLVAFIQFLNAGYDLPVPLTDISAEGASFYLETQLFPIRRIRPGSEISVSISFPDMVIQKIRKLSTKPLPENRNPKPTLRTGSMQEGKVTITARGKIMSVHPEAHLDRYRVGMKLYFQDLARLVIVQYISQRQAEIIRDLRLLSEELHRQSGNPG